MVVSPLSCASSVVVRRSVLTMARDFEQVNNAGDGQRCEYNFGLVAVMISALPLAIPTGGEVTPHIFRAAAVEEVWRKIATGRHR